MPTSASDWRVAGAWIAFLALYSLGVYGKLIPESAVVGTTDIAWTAASLAAAWRCWHTSRAQTERNLALAWYGFAAAAISWFTGMLIWDYFELVRGELVPFPSVADFFFVLFGPLFIAGTLYYRRQRLTGTFTLIQLGNIGIMFCAVVVSCVVILLEPIYQSESSLAYIGVALTLAVDYLLILFFAVFCLWFYVWRDDRFPFSLLTVSALIHAIVVTLYAFELLGRSYGAASYINILWLIAFALQYWAASAQQQIQPDDVDSDALSGKQLDSVVPTLSVLTVAAVVVNYRSQIDERAGTLILAMTALFAIFLAIREWWTARMQDQLLNQLHNANSDLERQVRVRTQDLELANKDLAAFSYSVSHDLRAPLRAISGFTRAITEDYGDRLDAAGNHYLTRIVDASKRMDDLINDVIELSRVSQFEPKPASVALGQFAREILNELRAQDPNREVDITLDETIVARGDPRWLRIALENLLGNAWKYTGKIQRAKIEFGKTTTDGESVYFVRDNGAGFDMRYADKMFTPFQRLHAATEFPGTGIGLATVARIIHRHSGRLWADARVDHGATFYFTLDDVKYRHS